MKISNKKIVLKSVNKGSESSNFSSIILLMLIVALAIFTIVYIIKLSRNSFVYAEEPFMATEEESSYTRGIEVILIYSEQCGHCVNFKPIFDSVAKRNDVFPPGVRVSFAKYESGTAAAREAISVPIEGVPVVFVKVNGQVKAKIVGFRTEIAFVSELRNTLQLM